MDIQMPVLDGYGAAKAIRALDREDAASIPIFAMTANAFEDDVLAARQAGMNGHIAKPVDMDRMRAVLAANMPPSPTTDA
ncbi:MAG: response regulator [Acutalibacteraceae bacterium]